MRPASVEAGGFEPPVSRGSDGRSYRLICASILKKVRPVRILKSLAFYLLRRGPWQSRQERQLKTAPLHP